MTIHLFLDIIVSIGIVLALTKKYAKSGLLLLCLSFLANAVVAFWVDNDVVQGAIDIVIIFFALYEYSKIVRHNYIPTKKGRLVAGIIFVLLGALITALGTLSPFLIAGLVSVSAILVEGFTLPKKHGQKP